MLFSAIITLHFALNIFASGSRVCPEDENQPWSYNLYLQNGPKYWSRVSRNCSGNTQSPIDIVTAKIVPDSSLKKLQLVNYDIPVSKFRVQNDRYTARVTPNDSVERSVIINGDVYNLNELHFHWGNKHAGGSEHTVNNKHYAMELHLVHAYKNQRTAVVSVFYKETLMVNSGLTPIIKQLRYILYRGEDVNVTSSLRLYKLVDKSCSYYRYEGSLTTPNCDEGVIWSICKEPNYIGSAQISRFRKLYSTSRSQGEGKEECRITNNDRPRQLLNGRIVKSSK